MILLGSASLMTYYGNKMTLSLRFERASDFWEFLECNQVVLKINTMDGLLLELSRYGFRFRYQAPVLFSIFMLDLSD